MQCGTEFTCTRASFMAAQLDTLQAHSSTRYGLLWPLDCPYSVRGSHWFSSLEQLEINIKFWLFYYIIHYILEYNRWSRMFRMTADNYYFTESFCPKGCKTKLWGCNFGRSMLVIWFYLHCARLPTHNLLGQFEMTTRLYI